LKIYHLATLTKRSDAWSHNGSEKECGEKINEKSKIIPGSLASLFTRGQPSPWARFL
jgi:hypothetical protein